MPGEPGSFFTIIFGPPTFREALGGDDLCVFAVAPNPLGLPLPDRGCCAGALFEAEGAGGGGGAGAVLWALGEVDEGGGRSEP
jgi:hypothetical protein